MNSDSNELKALAFFLPQYHPIPENDEWWGKGFTEWTNVAKASPRFESHYQPHLPADLGYYDLRVPETRAHQAVLAREAGIHGFCYYHYWFDGKRLLERPVNDILASGSPDFPFSLCWANEPWSRNWDGRNQDVLVDQTYSEKDHLRHIRFLAEVFSDKRYITIDNRPVFLIYRQAHIPEVSRMLDLWRTEISRLGGEDPYFCCIGTQVVDLSTADPMALGFDATVEFAPDWHHRGLPRQPSKLEKLFHRGDHPYAKDRVTEYADLRDNMLQKSWPSHAWHRCVCPSWDNSARRQSGANIFDGSTPKAYEEWLQVVAKQTHDRYEQSRGLLFINAWNEWAEGNHLEPDQRHGHAYLDATRRVLRPL